MKYTHLTQDERYQIAILAKTGHDKSEIARLIELATIRPMNIRGKTSEPDPVFYCSNDHPEAC